MARIRGTAGRDNLDGDDDNDVIRGLGGNDNLDGDDGNDRIYGGTGSDVLEGNDGHDRLFGQRGDDRLEGEEGNDLLFGGAGEDKFLFEEQDGFDKIGDFQNGRDRIVFDDDDLGFNDLTIHDNGRGDTVVKYDDNNAKIVLVNVDSDTITRADFAFDG